MINKPSLKKPVVGYPTPRVEGEEKVSGKATYAADVILPNMLWGKVFRSSIPFGQIKRIEISRALQLPGVKAVITGKDTAGMRIGRRIYDMPVLAEDIVRFIGEKVAAVAAETEEIAEEALRLIEAQYEEMDPLIDPFEAMQPAAKLLHPDVMSYRGLPHPLQAPSNLFIDMTWKKGDIEIGFRDCDILVENTFQTHVVHQAYIEPHSCVVKADPSSGGAEIWACCKVPFELRDQVATAVHVPPQKIVVHPCYIGGDFGGKGDFMDVPVCYFLSLKSGRPVKMVMKYDEEFSAGNPKHAAIVKVKTGVKKDGRITAHHMDFVFDSGAYGAFKPLGIVSGPEKSSGPYKIPHVFIRERMVYTNKVPCGHMRAPGQQQGFFANESQMDLVARELGIDPVKFRQINLMRAGDESPTGQIITYIKAKETLEKALQASGYYKPKPKNVGRGVAIVPWLPNGGEGYVFVKIDRDGGVTISSACLDQGTGTYTVLCEIVAEELEVPLDLIKVEALDTTKVPNDSGVGASRATRVYGNAVYGAVMKAKEELLQGAAEWLGETPDLFLLAKGGVLHKYTGKRMSYGEIVKRRGSPISVQGYYNDTKRVPEASVCAQVAEVEVDRETGEIKVRRITTAHHTGKILNPLMHQGQIDGGVIMGLGYALTEQLRFDGSKVITANFGDYKIPNIMDIPSLKTAIIEEPKGPGPYSSMSIGETPNIPVAVAIANAVQDAVGLRIKSLPITAEQIFGALSQ